MRRTCSRGKKGEKGRKEKGKKGERKERKERKVRAKWKGEFFSSPSSFPSALQVIARERS